VSDRFGLTVYGCDGDEARLFEELGRRFGIVPTFAGDAVPAVGRVATAGNRCVTVSHKSAVTEATLGALHRAGVELIITRSVGVDHIDLRAAAAVGIAIENAVYDPAGVADFTLMLILMAIRNAKEIVCTALANDFRLRGERGKDLRELTVGVVGVGSIGAAVVRRLQGFGCRVLASDRVCLGELLRASDVVSLHVPLTAATHHLIGRDAIAVMKPGAYLVNTGRGALVDTAALVEALEAGRLGGAALDVLEGEEGLFYFDCRHRPVEHDLLLRLQQMPNVVVTPHTAYYTQRALHDTVEQTLRKCRAFEQRSEQRRTGG
jgi:D-specific alpha-keto acid dehydrogenase